MGETLAAIERPTASRRPRVHDDVVGLLARRILSGEIAPGTGLPNTSVLSADLGVSRSALREATRVLGAKGLLAMRPGRGTTVRAAADWHLLDPDVLAWGGPALSPAIVRGLLECRLMIEPGAAAAAAQRATAQQVGVIESSYARMGAALPHDIEGCCAADVDFHVAIMRATGNPIIAQLAGTISAAMHATFRLSTSLADSHQRAMTAHYDLLDAIRLRNSEWASTATHVILAEAAHHLRTVLRAA